MIGPLALGLLACLLCLLVGGLAGIPKLYVILAAAACCIFGLWGQEKEDAEYTDLDDQE